LAVYNLSGSHSGHRRRGADNRYNSAYQKEKEKRAAKRLI